MSRFPNKLRKSEIADGWAARASPGRALEGISEKATYSESSRTSIADFSEFPARPIVVKVNEIFFVAPLYPVSAACLNN
jgi:hypothetical protein